jgi:y4mF family transcriptional regulator
MDSYPKRVLFSRSGKLMTDRILTPADIGASVRAARKAQGLRQDQLAGASGVGLRFIVDLEAGKPTIQMGKTLLVLQTLGCSIDIAPPLEPTK